MSRYFLGVDIGNTKSHALILDETGQAVGFAAGEPGNHEVSGVEGFRRALQAVVQAALLNAGLERSTITGAGFGIAGYDWPSDLPLMVEEITRLGLNAPFSAVNDSVIGLIAGTRRGWGVSVSAGTSSNCWGRDAHGKEGRVTGNGAAFGEYGGGIELVYRAIGDISRAWSLRGPETMLGALFVEQLGAKDVVDMLEGLARGRYHLRATQAPLVFQAAEQGDVVAQQAILWISRELGNLALGVIHQLGFADREFEVVLAGSLYKGSPLIATTMRDTIQVVAPGAELVRLAAPPVVGGALLGMEAAGVDFTAVRDHAVVSTERYVMQQA